MRIAYTTIFDANNIHERSGTPYHMAQAFIKAGIDIDFIGPLTRKLPAFFKIKQFYKKKICMQRESPRFNVTAGKNYSAEAANQLASLKVDAIVAPLINPIAYLDTHKPIILWTDAVYSALLGFYPDFYHHSVSTVLQGNEMTFACLARAKYAIFSSDWAANSAIERYGISTKKIKMIPYGANIDNCPTSLELKDALKKRRSNKIKLLFLAKSWERKGGDIACLVAKMLHENGHRVELTIVGYQPPIQIVPYIKCLGFISKQTASGKAKMAELFIESHFLILPSRADACPMVFAEACAFGLPSLTTPVGGISTAIKSNINGMLFGLDAPIADYCQYIINTLQNNYTYEALALSARNEYETRLNWPSAILQVKRLLVETL